VTAGAVLCGGDSRRMGTDKAFVEVAGVAMAERVARALAASGCDPVAFIGGDAALLARFQRATIADRWPGRGPVGAIITALGAFDDDVLIAACDLPFVDAASAGTLIAAATADQGSPRVDVFVAAADRPQPLLAWWRHECRPAVERAWAVSDGATGVRDIIAQLRSQPVAVAAAALRNVNRPDDLC